MDAEKKDVLDSLISSLNVLPQDAVEQIAKYVGGMKEGFDDIEILDLSELCTLQEEPFIGIWADRTDMADSSDRIRQLRQD